MSLVVDVLRGAQARPRLAALARLRIEVFRDWPYLYQGSEEYEHNYLAAYTRSPDAVFVLAMDGDEVVGASTGIPLQDDSEAFQMPFRARGLDPSRVFYFGESVLRQAFRGRGLGHRFFDEREAHARQLGRFDFTAFCAVDRAADDPRRPADYRGNEVFWGKRGYQKQDAMQIRLSWPEIGQGEVEHSLSVWLRPLPKS